MFNVTTSETTLSFAFSSRLDMIDRFIPLVSEFLEELSESGNSEYLRVVLRELLCNAVEHGNLLDQTKSVTGTVEQLSEHRYRCVVKDEGSGIPTDAIYFESTPDAERGRSMGYSIINSYSDEVRVAGSQVTVFVTLPVETSFEIGENGGIYTIAPNADISASISEKFRDILISWLDSPHTSCRIDFKNVTSIDSISLGIIVSFHRLMVKQNDSRTVAFVNVSSPIMDLFRLTQIHRMYQIED